MDRKFCQYSMLIVLCFNCFWMSLMFADSTEDYLPVFHNLYEKASNMYSMNQGSLCSSSATLCCQGDSRRGGLIHPISAIQPYGTRCFACGRRLTKDGRCINPKCDKNVHPEWNWDY